jgi:hypothetical protein
MLIIANAQAIEVEIERETRNWSEKRGFCVAKMRPNKQKLFDKLYETAPKPQKKQIFRKNKIAVYRFAVLGALPCRGN